MSEQEERLAHLNAEKNDLENTHPMAAKLLQDGNDVHLVRQNGGGSCGKWTNKINRFKNGLIS